MANRSHPLRLAYARTLQAILAIEVARIDVDAALGGDRRHLDAIEATLNNARAGIVELALAEGVNLGQEDDE
jgi:hypothetical protein